MAQLFAGAICGQSFSPIPRLHAPSFDIFRKLHLKTSTPAIISGTMAGWPATGMADIMAQCGSREISVARDESGNACEELSDVHIADRSLAGVDWAGLRELEAEDLMLDYGVATLSDLIAAQQRGQPLNLIDASTELVCPSLLEDMHVPAYFPVDYLQQLGSSHFRPYTHDCPSHFGLGSSLHPGLFIGSTGTGSGVHTDSRASRFWMVVLSGRIVQA